MSDMEGVAGIVNWIQVTGGDSAAYQQGRELYTEEINAAVRGARAGGATEVIVMDCHGGGNGWSFNALIQDRLDRQGSAVHSPTSRRSLPTTPAVPARSPPSSLTPTASRSTPGGVASRSSTAAGSGAQPPTGGRPGGSSTSSQRHASNTASAGGWT